MRISDWSSDVCSSDLDIGDLALEAGVANRYGRTAVCDRSPAQRNRLVRGRAAARADGGRARFFGSGDESDRHRFVARRLGPASISGGARRPSFGAKTALERLSGVVGRAGNAIGSRVLKPRPGTMARGLRGQTGKG